jgi:arginase
MSNWVVIGVPTSAGAHHAGQERAPAALREAGLIRKLREAGDLVADAGDLPGAVFAVDHQHPEARNLAAVTRVASEVADAVDAQLKTGRLPLVIGGDCTITLGVIAGFRRHHADVGLLYVDGDADLSGALGSDDSGILDSTGVAHLLGHGTPELSALAGPGPATSPGSTGRPGPGPGSSPRTAGRPGPGPGSSPGTAGRPGPGPLLEPGRLALIGGDPRETDDAGRRFLAEAGVSFQEGPALIADPAGTAARALAAIAPASGPLVVHFDVDTVDSADLPLANFPHYGSGVQLSHVVTCLQALRAAPAFAGLILTEVNPTHDPRGTQLARYVDAIVTAIAPPAAAAARAG